MAQKAPETRATPVVVHVDPQAVADIQQAMQDDLAWRRRGRRDRTVSLPPVLPAVGTVIGDSLRSFERLVGRQQPLKSL